VSFKKPIVFIVKYILSFSQFQNKSMENVWEGEHALSKTFKCWGRVANPKIAK